MVLLDKPEAGIPFWNHIVLFVPGGDKSTPSCAGLTRHMPKPGCELGTIIYGGPWSVEVPAMKYPTYIPKLPNLRPVSVTSEDIPSLSTLQIIVERWFTECRNNSTK